MSSIYDDEYRRIIGRIRTARIEAGLTQVQLAVALGVPQSFVSKTENAERRLDLLEFLKVCEALGVPPSKILGSGRVTRK